MSENDLPLRRFRSGAVLGVRGKRKEKKTDAEVMIGTTPVASYGIVIAVNDTFVLRDYKLPVRSNETTNRIRGNKTSSTLHFCLNEFPLLVSLASGLRI